MKKRNYLSLILMIVISLLAHVLSLLKSSIVAGSFGTGADIDAYHLANSIVSFVFGFVASGISTIIIPEYANKRDKHVVNTFITIIYGCLLVVIAVLMLLRYHIAGIFSNRDDIFVNLVANIMAVLLLSQYISSASNITVAFFQCEGRYNVPKVVNLIFQLAVVICLMFTKNITIMGYTFVLSIFVVLNFIFDTLIAIKIGWRFKPACNLNNETKAVLKKFFPIIFSTGVYKLSLMVDSSISALLDEGMITILSYSTQISTMVNAILVGNLLIYIYPKIIKTIKADGAQSVFWKQTAVFHSIVCLVIVGFFTIGNEGVELLFLHGKFSSEACKMVYIGAAIYLWGQQTSIIRDLIYRYFYAIGDTRTPATASVVVSILNISISIALVLLVGFYGIILGTIISSLISLIIIFTHFGNKVGFSEPLFGILKRYLVNLAIMAATAILVFITKSCLAIQSNLVSILMFGIETVSIYVVLTYLFNKEVLTTLKEI